MHQSQNYLKIKLIKINDEVPKTVRHQTSRSLKIHYKKAKLQESYDIFQYLKNDQTLKGYILNQQEKTDFQNQPQIQQSNKKNIFEEKDQAFIKRFNQTQGKATKERLLKAEYRLKRDLIDLNKITQNTLEQFSNHISLHNQWFCDKLLEQGQKNVLPFKPKYHVSTLQSPTQTETLNYPTQPTQIEESIQLMDCQNLDKCNKFNSNMQKIKQKLNTKLENLEQDYFSFIMSGNIHSLKEIMILKPNLIEAKTRLCETGLHVAVKRNQIQIVSFLLEHGINEYEKDIWGQTARQIAIKSQFRNILKLLSYIQN